MITPEERQDPDRLLMRLKESPWQLLFDTSEFSDSNIRQVLLRVHRDAEGTSYSPPALLREVLAPETFKHLRNSGAPARQAWLAERASAMAAAIEEVEVEVEVEVEEEVDVDAISCSDGVEAEDDPMSSSDGGL